MRSVRKSYFVIATRPFRRLSTIHKLPCPWEQMEQLQVISNSSRKKYDTVWHSPIPVEKCINDTLVNMLQPILS